MAKPRKEENVDALGQLFDFIFAESKKPPDKRKPIKVTGLSGSNELTDAIAAALEKPGLLMTDQLLESFNDALDLEAARLNVNEQGSANIKLSTGNLASLMKDPNSFIQKGFDNKKTFRKQMRAQYLGKTMQHFVAEGWARKYNLDLDARDAIRGSFAARHLDATLSKEERAKSYTSSNAIGALAQGRFSPGNKATLDLQSEKEHLAFRSRELVSKEVFGKAFWNNRLSEEQRTEFTNLQRSGAPLDPFFKKNFDSVYADKFSQRYNGLKSSVFDGKNPEVWDPEKYSKLEIRNLDSRIKLLQDYKKDNNIQGVEAINLDIGIKRLEQAKVIVNGQLLNPEDIGVARNQILREIENYRGKISSARASGDRETAKLYEKEIQDLKAGQKELNSIMLFGRIGQIEGYINSINAIHKDGNLVKSFLDGSFFDPNKNTLYRPTAARKGELSFGKQQGKVGVLVADTSKYKIINAYNKALAPIYYLTPKSIMRTLFVNGEGFVYLALMRKMGIENQLKDVLGKDTFGGIDIEGLLDMGPEKYLKSLNMSDPDIKKYLGDMRSLKSFAGVAKVFSFAQRAKDKIKDYLDDKIFKELRKKIGSALLQKVSKEAGEILTQWIAKGGIQTLVKGLVIAAANALGIVTTGGAANVVITVIAAVLVDIVYGVLRVLLLVTMLLMLGVIGLFFLGGSYMTSEFDKNSYAYTTVVPGEVVTNDNFVGLYPIEDGELPGDLHPFSGGSLPGGVQCLLGAQSYRCNQGPYGSYSHSAVVAVDLGGVTTFYAPTFCGEGNCVVTTVMDVNCSYGGQSYYAGGMVIFTANYGSTTYTFKLIHVYKSVSVGQKLSGGEAVADIITGADHSKISKCSSGPHLHLETKVGGASVNPMDVLTSPTSSGGFACNISACQ